MALEVLREQLKEPADRVEGDCLDASRRIIAEALYTVVVDRFIAFKEVLSGEELSQAMEKAGSAFRNGCSLELLLDK